MAYLIMPLRADLPAYSYQIELEGVSYNLSFAYSARSDRWVMDILSETNEPLALGIKLVTGTLLTERFVNSSLPPGDFFLSDTTNKNETPGKQDLGSKVLLVYRESTTDE